MMEVLEIRQLLLPPVQVSTVTYGSDTSFEDLFYFVTILKSVSEMSQSNRC